MADKIFKVRLQLRNDTEANWQAIGDTFIPLAGEACVTNDGENKGRFKIGDGTTALNALGYVADYDASIAAINAQITTLNGADTVTGSVSQKIKAAIDGLASVYQEKLPEGAATGKYLTADGEGNLI